MIHISICDDKPRVAIRAKPRLMRKAKRPRPSTARQEARVQRGNAYARLKHHRAVAFRYEQLKRSCESMVAMTCGSGVCLCETSTAPSSCAAKIVLCPLSPVLPLFNTSVFPLCRSARGIGAILDAALPVADQLRNGLRANVACLVGGGNLIQPPFASDWPTDCLHARTMMKPRAWHQPNKKRDRNQSKNRKPLVKKTQ